MIKESNRSRDDLLQRLKYTILISDYPEVDEILNTLVMKDNVKEVYQDLFGDSKINGRGEIVPSGFFQSEFPSASLDFAMYNLLGWAPDTFLLKHRIRRVEIRQAYGVPEDFRLPPGLFLLPNLEEVVVSGMGLKELPDLQSNCASLKRLDLSRNSLTHIPQKFLRFSQLTRLDLSYNHIETLPVLGNRISLIQSLSLKANRIKEYPSVLSSLKRLKELDLSMNQIQDIPEEQVKKGNLEKINLAFNSLNAQQEAFWEEGGFMGASQMDLPL